jgi:uncharacterized surface protein with fasciclin (FAS1) repeats
VLKTVAGAGALFAAGGVGTASARRGASAGENLVETAVELNSDGPYAGQFDALIDAVDPRLVDALTGRRQLTVFAPVDSAFDDAGVRDGDDVPVDVLTYHVAPGRRYANSVVNASTIPTLNGAKIDVEDELAGNIAATDVEASNGVIHAIDTVLQP